MEELKLKYLERLSDLYPSIAKASTEIINLQAILNLPKATEHFLTDIHGEYEAFAHVLKNGSGSIRRKIGDVFGNTLSARDKQSLATLIYYPREKMDRIRRAEPNMEDWYRITLYRLIEVCKCTMSKYTRSKVRKALPEDFAYVIEELITEKPDLRDKEFYYNAIINSIIETERAEEFIVALSGVIQRLTVDHLHIVGDIYDRGPGPHIIMDRLMEHHSVDIQWGNHDVVWMGAASGSPVCIFTVLKTSLAYGNLDLLETGYGISLRGLERFAVEFYPGPQHPRWEPHLDPRQTAAPAVQQRNARMHKAVTLLLFKLEAQVIARNPDFGMQGRDYLNHIDYAAGTVRWAGGTSPLLENDFPTVDPAAPAALTPREEELVAELVRAFTQSERLQRHVRYLYARGAVYKVTNGNLLFHGAVPMTADGDFARETFEGQAYSGRALFDYCDRRARAGYFAPPGSAARRAGQDFLWYLWCGALSPIYGRSAMTTFERLYIADKAAHAEVKNPYYALVSGPGAAAVAERILAEFGLSGEGCHILNGHVPVRAVEGEDPVKAGGRLVVIDGGFCRAYHRRTGIAGYTLVYNSRGLTLRTHQPFESTEAAIRDDEDIDSQSAYIYTAPHRILVRDTDEGRDLQQMIGDLSRLVDTYRTGLLPEQPGG